MENYISKSGKPFGAKGFEIGNDYIIVKFDSASYRYTYSSCGIDAVEKMKKCAIEQIGLSTYIAQNKPQYEGKF
jgi:hypothetical protein